MESKTLVVYVGGYRLHLKELATLKREMKEKNGSRISGPCHSGKAKCHQTLQKQKKGRLFKHLPLSTQVYFFILLMGLVR